MRTLLLLLCFGISINSLAQGAAQKLDKQKLCGNKWYCIQVQEGTGEPYNCDPKEKDDYLYYDCDGSFKTIEQGTTIKGHWFMNQMTGILTVSQYQTKIYPNRVVSHITYLDDNRLQLKGQDEHGQDITMFYTTR